MNDPRNIWQNQPTEPFKMSADELRRKAQQRQKKSRFEAVYSIIIGLTLLVFFAWNFTKVHEMVPRIGFGVLSLWCVYFTYQAYKWIWTGRLAQDATLNTTLQCYRGELEKRRDFGRYVWSKVAFVFLGVAMIMGPVLIESLKAPRLLLNAVPFFVLLAIWFAIFPIMRKRQQQQLQQELEELRVFERENRS
jgi:hypothetical protein